VALVSKLQIPTIVAALAAFQFTATAPAHAATEAALLIEADTGKVLFAENATVPWYPASTSKLMTLYVTLQAVKNHRLSLDSLITVSGRAASQAPSKIGFKPGTKLTVDNAIKILMVKSANDMAVLLAEGVSGSVEAFADEMNSTSKNLGMTQSSWVNPNGLPADDQISSARDLAILARSLIRDFPEYEMYWHIPAIQLGKKYMRNFNTLIGRYEGADGMKTGFICASGFNLVASATRGNRHLIAVVLGAPSSPYRAAKAAGLLERGFQRGPLAWLSPSLGTVDALQPVNTSPPDLREQMCGGHRKRPAAEEADDDNSDPSLLSSLPPMGDIKPSQLLKDRPETAPAITVFLGASKDAAENQFAKIRTKVQQKLAKGKKGAPATQAAVAPAAKTASAPATTQTLQTVSSPPAGTFTPPPGTQQAVRKLPAATDVNNPSVMSYAAKPGTGPAPLTAMPDAKPDPKAAAKATARTTAKTASTTTASVPSAHSKPKPKDAKATAVTKQAAVSKKKPAATTAAAPKQ
jgi:D-alanyl-D-alanine carboxypeptidase